LNILFLGTAAAEGIPNPFCTCPTCTHARKAGGRNVRARTSALVNDDLLIDCGPDLFVAAQRFGVQLDRLETLLVTHAHDDHWQPENLIYRHPDLCPTPLTPLRVFGPGPVTRTLRSPRHRDRLEQAALEVTTVRAGQRFRSGRYQVTALPANHAGDQAALLYIIHDGTRKLFYATDSGPLWERAWRIVAREAPFDAVLMDETVGHNQYHQHQGLETFLRDRQRFVDEGWLAEDARFVAFHFSHQSNPPHADLVDYFAPHGVIVAYDGMEMEI
jgi:phosphoribosyl 1,2-cyclic phosphate phosphodiesterase